MAAVVAVAGLALWLLISGQGLPLGFDTGQLGVALLAGTAWVSLYLLYRIPRSEFEGRAALGEWQAWIGLGFMAVSIAFYLSKLHLFQGAELWRNPAASAVARQLVLLLVAWTVISQVLASRWRGAVSEDERDREIAQGAAGWGRGALTFGVIAIAVTLGLSPQSRLAWATPAMVSSLLIFALMWGWLCEYAASAVYYWRDRR
ncbi:hypothetical protein DX914_08135 [Lysobacter silvisoli]|uniref:Uncharacterized protein n=1 Tax=Lysobacter silvisoli TaxID=2293254 RepID=A0A371K5B3_9GAMM|nr:hypothetical protein DX914_08135 [Lysobacter silvisoli]